LDILNFYKLKVCNPGIKIIYDNIQYHDLRSFPLLNYFGFNFFTYPYSWWKVFKADFLPYQYIPDRSLTAENLPKNLVCITNQYYETNEPIYSINKTIKKFITKSENNLVLLLDKKNLEIKGKVRPLDEEAFIQCAYSYEEIYNEIKKKYYDVGFEFLFQNTKNLFFQDMAILISEISDEEIKNFKDFFNNIYKYPYSPIWPFFTKIFGRKGSSIPTTRIERETLTKFFQRRFELKQSKLEKILKKFLEELNLTYLHLLDPILLRRNVNANFSQKIEKFKRRIYNIQDDDILRNKFLSYIKVL